MNIHIFDIDWALSDEMIDILIKLSKKEKILLNHEDDIKVL